MLMLGIVINASESTEDIHLSEELTDTKEKPCNNLLTLLDDKNRVIGNLRKQVENQKSQLMYYITRDLSPNKIEQFSRSCFPQASECSLPLNLAMNKFYRKMGVKTKLLSLHERMKILEKKISNLLTNQEYILKKIVNKWCDFFKVRQDSSFHEKFQTFLLNTVNVTLFDELLSATISLGNELENFKIACQRVLIIEEERNNIVEHVFSIPVEERLSRNGLLELHEEKIHLEAEIKRLRQLHGCQIGKGQMNELNVVENILQNLQHELNNNFLKNDENCITRMLQKINLEARMLLQLTKEQKRWRFNIPNLNRILFLFLMAVDNKDYPEDCQSAEEKWFFSQLKEAVIAWQTQLSQDNHVLKVKVKNLTSDNIQLNLQSKSLEQELKEVKFENATEVHRLKRERDIFKSQVKDLQIIREAYAQLVDKQPTITQNERDLLLRLHEKDLRISELEDLEEKFRGEIKNLHDNMQVTNKQMQVLNKFFNVTIKPILLEEQHIHTLKIFEDNFTPKSYWNSHRYCYKRSHSTSKKCVFSLRKPKSKVTRNFAKENVKKFNSLKMLFSCGGMNTNKDSKGETVTVVESHSGNKTADKEVVMENSSLFRVEMQYVQGKNGTMLDMNESEIFRDAPGESDLYRDF